MGSSREDRLDAQLAEHTAQRLISYLRSMPRPCDAHFDSVARVLEAREGKAKAVEAQLAFLAGVLREKDADEQAESSARLSTIEEESAPSEIHAARVAPDQTGTADLGIATLSSKYNQAPPVQQRAQWVEEMEGASSLKMLQREKDLPFKKRKWSVLEDDDEIVPLQPVLQEDEVQEGDLPNGSPVPVKSVPAIQITASPEISDKPGASQPIMDPGLVQEEEVQEGDLADRCVISLKRKADVVEVGEDVVTGVAQPPFKKSKLAVVEDDDDELCPLQPIKDSGFVLEEEVQKGYLASGCPVLLNGNANAVDDNDNAIAEDAVPVPPIQILKGLEKEKEAMVAMEDAPPVGEKQDASHVQANQTWEPTSACHSQSQLISVSATESKGNTLVEEENSEPPVAPTRFEENGEKGEIVLPSEAMQEDAEEPAHMRIVSLARAAVMVQEDEQEIMEEEENGTLSDISSCRAPQLEQTSDRVTVNRGRGRGRGRGGKKKQAKKINARKSSRVSARVSKRVASVEEENSDPPVAPADLEEDGDKGERGLPSEATQDVAEETAHLVQQDEQEIMEQEESRVGVLYPGNSLMADTHISSSRAPQLEQTSDRVTVSRGGRGRGRGRGGKNKKKQAKKKVAGESSRGRGRGRGGGRGRGRSTADKPLEAAPSSEGFRCWLIAPEAFPMAHEDGWLQRLLQDEKSSEAEHGGSTTSALTVLATASLMHTEASDTEWLRRHTRVENNLEGERDRSMDEEENAASALSVLACAALMVTDDSATGNDMTREECSARTNLRIRMDVDINGEGTSHDGDDGRPGNCTQGASQGTDILQIL